MFVNESILSRGYEKDALFAFFHCQRTGGSTMMKWFQGVFGKDKIYSRRTVPSWQTWEDISDPRVLEGFRLFGGFAYFRSFDLKRPIMPISMVRHPFYRIVSLYKMSRAHEGHFLHKMAIDSSFESFYRQGSARRDYYFHNLNCRRISGEPGGQAAIDVLHGQFGAVGVTNRLSALTQMLSSYYGWRAAPPDGSIGKVVPDDVNYASFAKGAVYDEIMSKNAGDLALYEHVSSQETQAPYSRPAPANIFEPDLLRRVLR